MVIQQISQASLSQLVIVDMQVKLAQAMPEDLMQSVLRKCGMLMSAASLLDMKVVLTEQYSKGLGHTLPALLDHIENPTVIEKLAFSCMAESKFKSQLVQDKPQVILAGMEAHICGLQTALDMQAVGKQVFVVEDAVISRDPENKANAMHRLRQAGVIVTNTESLLFECLGIAEGDAFKAISKLVR